jgi:hypothetical protein
VKGESGRSRDERGMSKESGGRQRGGGALCTMYLHQTRGTISQGHKGASIETRVGIVVIKGHGGDRGGIREVGEARGGARGGGRGGGSVNGGGGGLGGYRYGVAGGLGWG